MKKHLLILSIILLAISGFSQNVADSVYAVVNGNQVTIFQDNATRNCGFLPNLENIYIKDGVIKWYQVDQSGEVYGCMCTFDYSVSIDSLPSGTYNAEVYFVYFSDTTFDGNTTFTVASPNICDNNLELSSYAGTCEVSVKNMPIEKMGIEFNGGGLTISLNSNEKILKASLINISGQTVFSRNYTSGSEIFIPTSSFQRGAYVVSVITASGQYNHKVVLGM